MNVLLIDDDIKAASELKRFMKTQGVNIDICPNGTQGVCYINSDPNRYQGVIIDLKLDGEHGLDIINMLNNNSELDHSSSMKKYTPKIPIFIWSGTAKRCDEVAAWNSGKIIDFIPKPSHAMVFAARIKAHIFNNLPGYSGSDIKIGNLSFKYTSQYFSISGVQMSLSSSEYNFLEYFVINRGSTITKNMIMKYLYADRHQLDVPHLKIVDVLLCKIRSKIKKLDPHHEYIITNWGKGYKLLIDPELHKDKTVNQSDIRYSNNTSQVITSIVNS